MLLQDVVVRKSRGGSGSVLDDARQVFPDVVNVEQSAQLLVLRRKKFADAGVQR